MLLVQGWSCPSRIQRNMTEKRLRDVATFGTSPDQIAPHLRPIRAAIADSAIWIEKHHPRNDRRVVLCNLLVAPLPYVDLYAQNPSGPLPLHAFCTRTVFELNVRVRHVLLSPDNLKKWVAETAQDRTELLEAIIGIAEANDPRTEIVRTELNRIASLKLKHHLPEVRKSDTQVATLAREVGLERERKSLFKIFSKLVHPTAYLVNSGNVMTDPQMGDLLLVHFQIYTRDLLKRISDEMGVPPEVISSHNLRRHQDS